MSLRRIGSAAALLLIGLAIGCTGTIKPVAATYDNRPTLPLEQVLAHINENNGRISTLIADGRFDANIANGDGGFEPLAGGLSVAHTKPNQIRITGEVAVVGQRAFDLGCNSQRYWMSAYGKMNTTWYGTPRGTAVVDPRLPIAPELLIDVLGVATLNMDLLAQPIPTLRYNPDQAVYMLTWHQPITDRWVTLREVWYDRTTFRPIRVILFNRDGRAMLVAKLSNYQPMRLDQPSNEGPPPPVTARTFELFFPENRSTLRFTLDAVFDRRGGAPNRVTYSFNPTRANTARQINLDQQPATQP